ncbi:type II secretion system major pseudopilin GspG [Burkholderia contaminans]|uniref:type II secretion system major pseudopilin GspG n=1 Tax=Burkholderia contaminans TaxID=488447 RepID=UPI0018DDC17C|nr:type II secretion system major pseudopilin GspG [Burkholderia contaminans]
MKIKPIVTVCLLSATLAACSPTHVSGLDRVVKVEEFDQQLDLRKRVVAECNSNPGQLKDDPNCINANASQDKADKQRAEEQQKAAMALVAGVAAMAANPDAMRQEAARRIAARQDIGVFLQALKLYRLDNGRYPSQEQGLTALVQKPTIDPVPNNWKDGGYIERLPNDPWGNSYKYLNPGAHGEIDVFSYGADGKEGGEGNDGDIGSWQ